MLKAKRILQIFLHCILILILISCKCEKVNNEKLYQVFQSPPAEARPFVRWWWNGNCIEEKEINRELDMIKQSGIGGIEINPIAMPDELDNAIHCDCYDWLSPEWNQLIKKTIEAASDRDIVIDLIVGSGWPFGGRFLEKDEIIQGVGINKIKLNGPSVYKVQVKDIMKLPGRADTDFDGAATPQLFFLRMIPANSKGTTDVIDVMNKVDESGLVSINVPKGEYNLIVGCQQFAFREVYYGAPGSDGPVLDHFNEKAVLKYLNRMSDRLEAVLGGKLGDKVRAIFCDSIELAGANWTSDYNKEFIKRNGYDLTPWLPFVFYNAYTGYADTLNYTPAFSDSIQRVRYDFNKTLVDVFLDRFTIPFHNWANEHGMLSRYQSYGYPWLVGMSEGYMITDIPEGNNWIFSNASAKEHGYWIWNKYTSSSAHFTNKAIISSEAMTNTSGVFRAAMEQIKEQDDFNFIIGINHSVLHGFNYSPPEAGFPGWVRYGTYFNENNTWWPHFPLWSKYNARLSAVFQEAKPVSEVAILAPFTDHYSDDGLFRVPMHLEPWYAHDLWESCSQLGYNADYLNESAIQTANFKNDALNIGPMKYQVLFVAGAKSMQPQTALALQKYAKAGGKIVFIENLPQRAPGLKNANQNDALVKKAIGEAMQSNMVELIQPPENSKSALLQWTKDILQKYNISSFVTMSEPHIDIFQNHLQYGKQKLAFFSNQNSDKTISFNVEIDCDNNIVPWIWLAESGKRMLYPYQGDKGSLNISLQPFESALIVYDKETDAEKYLAQLPKSGAGKMIKANWNITFRHMNGDSFRVNSAKLFDFAKSKDKRFSSFAGTASYESIINLHKTGTSFIDLGDISHGITELYVNSKKVGVKWYGKHIYNISDVAINGENEIKIIYTTTLANYVQSMKTSVVAQKWVKRWKHIDGPIQQGIVGPVLIRK